jgi:hypothetical protein
MRADSGHWRIYKKTELGGKGRKTRKRGIVRAARTEGEQFKRQADHADGRDSWPEVRMSLAANESAQFRCQSDPDRSRSCFAAWGHRPEPQWSFVRVSNFEIGETAIDFLGIVFPRCPL